MVARKLYHHSAVLRRTAVLFFKEKHPEVSPSGYLLFFGTFFTAPFFNCYAAAPSGARPAYFADAPQAALLRALGCEVVEGRAETAADVLAFADTLGELFPGRTNGLAVAGSKWREEMEKISHAESAEAIASARLASGVSRPESHAESAENAERVLVVVSHAPGQFGAAFAAGEGTYLDEILRAAGFANALAGVKGYPSLDPDRIAALAPDLLIDVHPDGDPPDEDAWSYLPKTRVETLHDTAALRPGPRLPEVLERFRALRR